MLISLIPGTVPSSFSYTIEKGKTYLTVCIALHAGLEINFDEFDYSTEENDITGFRDISLSFRETQAPFSVELIPTTIDVAIRQYNLTAFLHLDELEEDMKAQSGETYT